MTKPETLTGPVRLPADPAPSAPGSRARLAHWGRNPMLTSTVVALVVMFLVPALFGAANLSLVTTAAIFGLFALSGLVLFGWLGLGSFGQAAFFGTGAYAAALLRDDTLNPLLVVLIGAVAACVLALVIGLLAGNTTGRQFAMLTLVLGQVLFQLTFTLRGLLHGDDGIFGIYPGTLFGSDLSDPVHFWWYSTVITGVFALLLYGVHRSQLGKSFAAVRDDALKAAALGTSVRLVRIAAFLVAGFVAGAAGALYAQQQSGVSPDVLSTTLSGSVIFMVLIGGTSSMWGPIIGALVYTYLTNRLFPNSSISTLFIGGLLLIVVIGVRGGVVGLVRRGAGRLRQRSQALRTAGRGVA
jgi:branched-chain amino acid transport system permease protein